MLNTLNTEHDWFIKQLFPNNIKAYQYIPLSYIQKQYCFILQQKLSTFIVGNKTFTLSNTTKLLHTDVNYVVHMYACICNIQIKKG
jgi:hypothetical protein